MTEESQRRRSSTTDPEAPNADSKSKPGAKPRASRAGTRSVSTLNAEQLARKRANDREAQRAIRQRTREHIERLENRIKELSDNSPESDGALEAMQRRNSELEEELRQLRRTLFGMEEGSNSPGGSHHHPGFVPSSRPKVGPVAFPPPQPQWTPPNAHVGSMSYAPTSNPMPESDPTWQPPIQASDSRRGVSQHSHSGFPQAVAWSRNDSSDSDYDSGYGLEQEQVEHPVRVYPEHMHNYLPHHPHSGRHGAAVWQTPASSSGMSTPYEAHAQLPSIPPSREDPGNYGYGSASASGTGNKRHVQNMRQF